jgi:hypothetical protein
VVTKADTICAICKTTAEIDKYEEDLKAARNFGDSWYIVATLGGVRYFICIGCQMRYVVAKNILEGESEEPPKPIMQCCVQTFTCKSAAFYWGAENREPINFLHVYQEEMRPLPAEPNCAHQEEMLHPQVEPNRVHEALKKLPCAQGGPHYDALYAALRDAAERYKDNPNQAGIDAAPIMAITKQAIADVAAGR